MKPISYPPLFMAVAVLQLVVVTSVAYIRVFASLRWSFLLVWSTVVLATVAVGYARRDRRKGRLAQFSPIVFAIAAAWLWSAVGATRALFVLLGLGLLAGRNCVLADRRSLYFDLAIAIAIFFDTAGLQRSFEAWPYALAFLVALVFVLMADYSDRRLAFVHGSDTERSEASHDLLPGVANAGLATFLVLLVGAFIYLILPQPAPLQYGVPFGEAPGRVYSADALTAMMEGGDEKPSKGLPRQGTAAGGAPQGGEPEGARLDVSRSGAGIRPAQESAAMAGGDPGRQQGESKGGKQDRRQGGDRGSAAQAQGAQRQADKDREGGQQAQAQGEAQKPSEQRSSTKQPDEGAPPSKSPDSEPNEKKKADEKTADDEQPLMLLKLAARHPLYVRTHVFTDYGDAEWTESRTGFTTFGGVGIWGRWNSDGRFGVTQRYEVLARLDPRIPAAYRMDRLGFPSIRVGISAEDGLRAPEKIEPGTRYNVRSTVQYVDGRASGGFERLPKRDALGMPRDMEALIQLAGAITKDLRTPGERAAALEKYVRENYRAGSFAAGGAEAMQAFLFEQRQGGSEQFASALALLMRASGLQARVATGYRSRRLNPIHGAYEIWRSDRHHWVEAHVNERWTVYEPAPWATLLPDRAPASAWEAAREYVRLARHDDQGAEVRPPDRPSDAYLALVLAVGWLTTFGPWVLAGLLAFGILAWRRGALVRPILDLVDRVRLSSARRLDPRARVLAVFRAVEGIFARRGVRRGSAENHAEFLERAALARPQAAPALKLLAGAFAQARYGKEPLPDARAESVRRECVGMLSLLDEFEATGVAAARR